MIWQQLVNGVSLGASYALIALGYNLVFGVLGVLNMAHGDLAIVGAYGALVLAQLLGLGLVASVVAGMVGAGLAGAIAERVVIRPVVTSPVGPFITTIGLSMVSEFGLSQIFGPDPKAFPSGSQDVYEIGSVSITGAQILIGVIAILLLVGLSWMVMRTQLGRFIRAIAENRETAAFLGVNVDRVGILTLVIASSIAGAAGVLLGQYYGAMTPFLGLRIGLKGLIVLIVGGVGNFYGTMVTGLLLGLIEVYTTVLVSSAYTDLSGYLLLFLILVAKPTGLFGGAALQRD
jgi:branched-chain amino acid transport system permease protein